MGDLLGVILKNIEPCTNVQSEPFSPASGNTLLAAGDISTAYFFAKLVSKNLKIRSKCFNGSACPPSIDLCS